MIKELTTIITNEIYSKFPYCTVNVYFEPDPFNCDHSIIVEVYLLHLGNKKGVISRFSERMFNMSRDRAAFIESFVKECIISQIENLQEEIDD